MDMLPEDRLDSLVSHLQAGESLQSAALRADAGELVPLLDAVSPFAAWGDATPSRAFANRLERQLLEQDSGQRHPVPSSSNGASAGVRSRHAAQHVSRLPFSPRVLWPALVAMLVLALGGGILAAAASAAPGHLLYGVRRWEQGVSVLLANSAADRVRLHLRYASDALQAFNAAVDGHAGGQAYSDALGALHDESIAATATLHDVPAGQEHASLARQLDDLQTRGRASLRASLLSLSWRDRALVTTALAGQGQTVLSISSVTLARVGTDGHSTWKVTVTGSGFQQGAVLLVNGSPAGVAVSVTPTLLVAQLPDSALKNVPGSLGVGNPDHTATITGAITHDPDENEGGDPNNGDSGGGDNATSTPTPGQASPTDSGSSDGGGAH